MHRLIVDTTITSEYILRIAVNRYFYAQIKDLQYRKPNFNLCIKTNDTQQFLIYIQTLLFYIELVCC